MKKIAGLMALLLILGCDDGDMTFQTFDFTDAQVSQCNDDSETLFKVNGTEALVLNIAPASFANIETGATPRIVTIGGANTVQYLKYDTELGTNPQNIICGSLPSVSAIEVWNANGGTIRIETTARHEDENDTSIITGYTHTITLVSVSFTRNEETIIIQDNEFGSYQTDLLYDFNFNGTGAQIQRCPTVNPDRLYVTSQDEVLRMDLDVTELFQNVAIETPRVQVLTGEEIFLDIYANSNFLQAQICDPASDIFFPNVISRWNAVSGSVEVTTAEPVPGTFEHTIKLVDVTFENTQNSEEEFTRTSYTLPVYTVVE